MKISRLREWLRQRIARERPIDEALWRPTISRYSFLQRLSPAELLRLRQLCAGFLARKQFHGANGLQIDDQVALAVAAQACLPLLHLKGGLNWYSDFVGIVIHPSEMLAQREVVDEIGVVHRYREAISGEAMDKGPVTLNWQDVAAPETDDGRVFNLVIHEFAHKIDLRDGVADGCPPLPAGFLGSTSRREARTRWLEVLTPAYESFREQAVIAERFSGKPTWLDPYAAQSPSEFFAVACEAYFVSGEDFSREFPQLATLFDAFFKSGAATS